MPAPLLFGGKHHLLRFFKSHPFAFLVQSPTCQRISGQVGKAELLSQPFYQQCCGCAVEQENGVLVIGNRPGFSSVVIPFKIFLIHEPVFSRSFRFPGPVCAGSGRSAFVRTFFLHHQPRFAMGTDQTLPAARIKAASAYRGRRPHL